MALHPYIGVVARLYAQYYTTAGKADPYNSPTIDNTVCSNLHHKLLGKNHATNIPKPVP